MCLWCQKDLDQQKKEGLEPVPRRSYLNDMDPCWNFPHEELGFLFASATVTESMLVALEHMQVSYVTVRKTGLERFRKNTISFPQDIARFAVRMEMLRPEEYHEKDRVNSRRGPGRDVGRPELRADDPSVEGRERFGVDEYGCPVEASGVRRATDSGVRPL